SDQGWTSYLNTHIDPGMECFFELRMHFLPDQAVLKAGPRARHQCGGQAILFQDWNLLARGQVDTFEPNAGECLAPLLEREIRPRPHGRHHALLDAGARTT